MAHARDPLLVSSSHDPADAVWIYTKVSSSSLVGEGVAVISPKLHQSAAGNCIRFAVVALLFALRRHRIRFVWGALGRRNRQPCLQACCIQGTSGACACLILLHTQTELLLCSLQLVWHATVVHNVMARLESLTYDRHTTSHGPCLRYGLEQGEHRHTQWYLCGQRKP